MSDGQLRPYVSTAVQQFAPGNFVTTWNPELGRNAVGVTRAIEDRQEANPRVLVKWLHDLSQEWIRSEYLYAVKAEGRTMEHDVVINMLRWVRAEIFSLCEYTESSAEALAEHEADETQDAFDRGRIFEAKRIRNAIGEVISEKLRTLTEV